MKIERIPTASIDVDDVTVSLGQSRGVSGDRIMERRLTQDFYWAVESQSPTALGSLMGRISDLQDIVSIGTGRTAAYRRVQLRHHDASYEFEGGVREIPIELLAAWQVANEQPVKTLTSHDMFFRLPDLGGMEGIKRWLALAATHRSALSRVMSTRYATSMFVSDKLLNCAAALESYDRERHSDKRVFASRIKRCVSSAGDVFASLVGDVDAWTKAFKASRNDIAHHDAGLATASTQHLFLADSAYWLFVLCLLRDALAPDDVFDQISKHQRYRWLRRRLQESL